MLWHIENKIYVITNSHVIFNMHQMLLQLYTLYHKIYFYIFLFSLLPRSITIPPFYQCVYQCACGYYNYDVSFIDCLHHFIHLYDNVYLNCGIHLLFDALDIIRAQIITYKRQHIGMQTNCILLWMLNTTYFFLFE